MDLTTAGQIYELVFWKQKYHLYYSGPLTVPTGLLRVVIALDLHRAGCGFVPRLGHDRFLPDYS
jgi:hypothetical protein